MPTIDTKEDLLNLIRDEIGENAELEYKGAGALSKDIGKLQELTKDVSAFANASGGTIIYGIAETKNRDFPAKPDRLDPVNAGKFSKEWLDQMIGRISPRIPGVKIKAIHLGPEACDFAYVVEVPRGSTAHQSLDHRYYARRNFEVTAMLDFEIRDVMQRTTHPSIDAEIRIIGDHPIDPHIAFRLSNPGTVMARHYALVARFPLKLRKGFIRSDDARLETQGPRPPHWVFSHSNNGGGPLFPGSQVIGKWDLEEVTFMKPDLGASLSHIELTLYADNMPAVSLIKDINEAHTQWI